MKEQKLVYAEKSAKPSLLRILFWILVGDFLACILYGIAMGAGGSIDKQMENAPLFLAELTVITVVLTILFYRIAGKRVTTIAIYERTAVFSAPKIPMLDEDDGEEAPSESETAEVPVQSEPESEPEPEPEPDWDGSDFETREDVPRRVNPYLRGNRQKPEDTRNKPEKSAEASRKSKKKIGKVTSDQPNVEMECPVSELRSASRKGKNVVLILDNGDRYLFVRMSGAEQLVKVIEDKVAAEMK